MVVGSVFKDGKKTVTFTLTEQEYERLLAGESITKRTASAKYEKATFTLTFSGTTREGFKPAP